MEMKLNMTLIWLCILLCSSCQQNSNSQAEKGALKRNQQETKKVVANPITMKLVPHYILDREGSGMTAITCLIPEGWSIQDRLYWEYQDATLPIRYEGTLQSENGRFKIFAYPDIRSVYSEGPTGSSGYPPPQNILIGLKDFIKRHRQGIQYQITEEKIINRSGPSDHTVQGTSFRTHSTGGLVRIRYKENQNDIEEEFYGNLEITNSLSQGYATLSGIIWWASGLYSCKAPIGELEKCRRIALTVKSSSKLTLAFYNKFIQVTQLLSDAVYQRIYAAGQISKIISQTNDQISKTISDSYWNTQKSNERSNQQFSDYLRGVDRYSDGQNNIQLPSGYTNAWVNDKGEYLMSETQGFNPNQELQGNWKQLDKRH
ncbi:MAG: hypothetical protein V9E90_07325 [Saprospiraceae bacterium]|jgi:hypothetical protein